MSEGGLLVSTLGVDFKPMSPTYPTTTIIPVRTKIAIPWPIGSNRILSTTPNSVVIGGTGGSSMGTLTSSVAVGEAPLCPCVASSVGLSVA